MVAGGPRWAEAFVRAQPAETSASASSGRCATSPTRSATTSPGRCVQATIAGVTAFIVLTILGAPFAGLLALIVAFFDLIPVVGATIAAVLIGVVMIFVNFPVGADRLGRSSRSLYQQFENYVIQPQIQRRAVEVEPFIVLVAVLFGSTLFGILGAVLAIPAAATLQISGASGATTGASR